MNDLLSGLSEIGKEIMNDVDIVNHQEWCEQNNTKIQDVNVYNNTLSARIDRYW